MSKVNKNHPSFLLRRTRLAFIRLGAFFLLFAAIWAWVISRSEKEGVQWPLRQVLNFNDSLSQLIFDSDRVALKPTPPPLGQAPRFNGDLGLEQDLDVSEWRLHVVPVERPGAKEFLLSMAEIKSLPRTETTALFKCIEGWSDPISYAGVRFSDFLRYLKLENASTYVGLSTPDGKYYVSIDFESMLHSQTLLAYEMNGAPLSEEDGAPLRLIIPVKYGIKSLKRIGTLRFSNTRPPDYWFEQGYDWFAGL